MRFQQLKRDPNSIVRKKLVKSKKSWIVVSSLSFAGGLFFLGGPTEIVHAADTVTAPTEQVITSTSINDSKTTDTKQVNVNKDVAPTTIEGNSDTVVQSDTTTPVEKETTTTEKNYTNGSNVTPKILNTETKPTVTNVQDTQDDTLADNLAASKTKLTSLGINTKDLAITPETETLADGNIAEGTQGTTPWSIDADGVLHLGTAEKITSLANNTATTTEHTSTGSTVTETNNKTTSSPTSPWMKHSNDIKSINFDGEVNTASDMSYMFANLTNLTTITNAGNLKTNSGQFMNKTVGMFANDSNLKEITSSTTSNTTDPKVDLSSWYLGDITDANSMFLNDSSITSIVFPSGQGASLAANSNFNYMFKNDTALLSSKILNLQFHGAITMVGMYQNDKSLTDLDLSSWNLGNASTVDTGDSSKGEGMFDGTDSLASLTLSSVNRFSGYTALSSKKGSSWNGGGKTISSNPNDADNLNTFNLNSIVSHLGSGVFVTTKFVPDGNIPESGPLNLVIHSNLGDINKTVQGPIYSSVDVPVPAQTGYTSNVSSITANILEKSAVTNYYVTYTRNATTATISTSKGTQTIDIPAGAVGTTSDPITLPTVNGYDSPQIKVQYKIDGNVITDLDGNPISETNEAKYTGSKVALVSPNISTPTNNKTNFIVKDSQNNTLSSGSEVHVDDQVSVTPPVVEGYTPFINGEEIPEGGIKGTISTDGSFIPSDSTIDLSKIEYKGNEITPTIPTISTPDNKQTSTAADSNNQLININEKLHVGDTVTITLPKQDGYKAFNNDKEITTVAGTIDAKGNFVPNDSSINFSNIKYIGDEIIPSIPTISTPDGKETSSATDNNNNKTISADELLHVGDTVTIILPFQDGYKALNKNNEEVKTVTGTINFKKEFVPNPGQPSLSDIKYVGNVVTPKIDSISTPDGGKSTLTIAAGDYIENSTTVHVGDSVIISVPKQIGYHPIYNGKAFDGTKLTGTIGVNGEFISSNKISPSDISYVGNDVSSWSTTENQVKIPTGNTTVSGTLNSDGKPAKIGDTVTIAPEVPGYTISKSGTATIAAGENGDPVITHINQPTYSGNPVTLWSTDKDGITIPNGKTTVTGTLNSDGKPAKIGDTVTIAPEVPGYTLSKSGTATIAADKNGDPVITHIAQPQYIGNNTNPITINFKTPNGNESYTIPAGKVGDKVTVTVPNDVLGYTPNSSEITGSINEKGDFVPDEGQITPANIKYIGNTIPANITNNVSTPNDTKGIVTKDGIDITTGTTNVQVGEDVVLNIPKQPGYHVEIDGKENDVTKILGKIDHNGNFVPNNGQITPADIKYVGNTINSWSTTKDDVKIPTGNTTVSGTTNSNNEPVKIGDTVIIAPKVPGYTISKPGSATITADKDGNPIISNINQPTYSANSVNSWSTAKNIVETPTGNTTVSGTLNSDGNPAKIGDKVTIAPEIPGYTISTPGSATITADKDGNPIIFNITQPKFSANPVNSWSTAENNVETPIGNTTVSGTLNSDGNPAKIGDKVTIAPEIPGYTISTPGSATITADKDGNPVISNINQPKYEPKDTKPIPINFKTPTGDESYTIPAGKVGDKVTVTVPNKIKGYYPTSSEITGTISANNTFIPDNGVNISDIQYLGVENKATTINLKTPDGKMTSLDIPAGRFGDDSVTVTAKNINGYTSPSVTVTFGADGTPVLTDAKNSKKIIKISDTLTYSRIPVIIHKDPVTDNPIPTPKQNHQDVATYSEKGQIYLYTLNKDNKMTIITYRGLAKQSTWYSDEQITVDGIQYLRVATNEWIKASQAYPYQDLNQYIRTYDKTAKALYKSEDEIINNRVLQPNSSWYSDRTTEVINGEKYYRVATNEFVSAKDAYIYQPTNMVVKTHSDSASKNLYTAKGELITNRSLTADSAWIVDSIIYIEGIKYYRVATNEFVKASDVDINH